MRRFLSVGAFVVLAALGGSPRPASPPAVVKVDLYDWGIRLDRAEAPPGPVTFEVRNASRQNVHELVVLETNLPAMRLPYEKKLARVDERKAGNLGEVSDLKPGEDGRVTLRLAPGRYVLICNEPGHYRAGMIARLTVD